MIRNIFPEEEHPQWQAAIAAFPNKVPRFGTKDEAISFIKKQCRIGSNPRYPHLKHSVTTLVDWGQVEQYLLPKLRLYESKYPPIYAKKEMLSDNRFVNASSSTSTTATTSTSTTSSSSTASTTTSDSAFTITGHEGQSVYDYLYSRLSLSVHRTLTPTSTLNTLRYLFFHMRCGILVSIRNNSLVIFCPFVNKDYRNTWGDKLLIDSPDGTVETYYNSKAQHFRDERFLPDKFLWWANGNIICNEHEEWGSEGSQYWGDHFLFQLKDMIAETCRLRQVPDCDFFVNKRDYPQLKFHKDVESPQDYTRVTGAYADTRKIAGNDGDNTCVPGRLVEPYGFIFGKDDKKAEDDIELDQSHAYKSYAPVLSFYTSERFSDIPFPPSEDWEAATGQVFPGSFSYTLEKKEGTTLKKARKDGIGGVGAVSSDNDSSKASTSEIAKHSKMDDGDDSDDDVEVVVHPPRDLFTRDNLKKFHKPWESKVNTAFFRGTATGGGVTATTNQRLHLAVISNEWSTTYPMSGNEALNEPPYLDAKITAWNLRDKKIASSPMTYVKKENFPFMKGDLKQNFVEIYKQGNFKYILYVEGHCAACRYGFMMQLGSVILKVDSLCVADQMWYFPLLKSYVDHVPVKSDLSDLREKIEWCRNNDEKCRQIAEAAQKLYAYYVSTDGVLDYMQAVFYQIAMRKCQPPDWAKPTPPAMPTIKSLCCNGLDRNGNPRQCYDGGLCASCSVLKERSDKKAAESSNQERQLTEEEQKIQARRKEKREMERKKAEKKRAEILEKTKSLMQIEYK